MLEGFMTMSKYLDFASHAVVQKEIEYYTQRFILRPRQLVDLSLPVVLNWQRIRFVKKYSSSVVEAPGIYAFVIQHDGLGLPPHGYVAYIGQTGAERQKRTLRDRFNDYFGEKKRPKRKHIWELLNKWDECLFFHFAPVDVKRADLAKIEQQLNDAMMPPYSRFDFSADIRKRKRIWEVS
jgi:hypothetical protein